MIKKEDIENFNTLMKQLNDLQEKIKNYNQNASINLFSCCDKNENDYCALFITDGNVKEIKNIFITGKKLENAEFYSRSDIKTLIENIKEKL